MSIQWIKDALSSATDKAIEAAEATKKWLSTATKIVGDKVEDAWEFLDEQTDKLSDELYKYSKDNDWVLGDIAWFTSDVVRDPWKDLIKWAEAVYEWAKYVTDAAWTWIWLVKDVVTESGRIIWEEITDFAKDVIWGEIIKDEVRRDVTNAAVDLYEKSQIISTWPIDFIKDMTMDYITDTKEWLVADIKILPSKIGTMTEVDEVKQAENISKLDEATKLYMPMSQKDIEDADKILKDVDVIDKATQFTSTIATTFSKMTWDEFDEHVDFKALSKNSEFNKIQHLVWIWDVKDMFHDKMYEYEGKINDINTERTTELNRLLNDDNYNRISEYNKAATEVVNSYEWSLEWDEFDTHIQTETLKKVDFTLDEAIESKRLLWYNLDYEEFMKLDKKLQDKNEEYNNFLDKYMKTEEWQTGRELIEWLRYDAEIEEINNKFNKVNKIVNLSVENSDFIRDLRQRHPDFAVSKEWTTLIDNIILTQTTDNLYAYNIRNQITKLVGNNDVVDDVIIWDYEKLLKSMSVKQDFNEDIFNEMARLTRLKKYRTTGADEVINAARDNVIASISKEDQVMMREINNVKWRLTGVVNLSEWLQHMTNAIKTWDILEAWKSALIIWYAASAIPWSAIWEWVLTAAEAPVNLVTWSDDMVWFVNLIPA